MSVTSATSAPPEQANLCFAAIEALRADGPLPELRDKLMLFGQFVGSWRMEISFFHPDGTAKNRITADWLFSWVLHGRAIQDVMLSPCQEDRIARPNALVTTGSTLRYFDPVLDAWRVVWVGASANTYITLIARKRGDEILLEGLDMDGSPLQWIFSDITPDTFRWRGLTSKNGGKNWYMEEEMHGQRRTS